MACTAAHCVALLTSHLAVAVAESPSMADTPPEPSHQSLRAPPSGGHMSIRCVAPQAGGAADIKPVYAQFVAWLGISGIHVQAAPAW